MERTPSRGDGRRDGVYRRRSRGRKELTGRDVERPLHSLAESTDDAEVNLARARAPVRFPALALTLRGRSRGGDSLPGIAFLKRVIQRKATRDREERYRRQASDEPHHPRQHCTLRVAHFVHATTGPRPYQGTERDSRRLWARPSRRGRRLSFTNSVTYVGRRAPESPNRSITFSKPSAVPRTRRGPEVKTTSSTLCPSEK